MAVNRKIENTEKGFDISIESLVIYAVKHETEFNCNVLILYLKYVENVIKF